MANLDSINSIYRKLIYFSGDELDTIFRPFLQIAKNDKKFVKKDKDGIKKPFSFSNAIRILMKSYVEQVQKKIRLMKEIKQEDKKKEEMNNA